MLSLQKFEKQNVAFEIVYVSVSACVFLCVGDRG